MRPVPDVAPPRAEVSATPERPVTASIAIPGPRIIRVLWSIMAGLVVLGIVHMAIIDRMSETEWRFYANLLALDGEQTLPAWFSSMMMAGSAVLCFVISRSARVHDRANKTAWFALGLIFLFLSLDEVASIHERVGATVQRAFDLGGSILHFSWIVVAAPLLVLAALGFARFLRRLPSPFGVRILVAGLVFVMGAFGFEVVGSILASGGDRPFWYWVEVTAEETLEMAGLILFIATLLDYLATTSRTVTLDFSPE